MSIIKKEKLSNLKSIDVALDIGSSKIACVVGKSNIGKKTKILGHSLITTKNVKKGYVVDSKKLEIEIKNIIDNVSKQTEIQISSVKINANLNDSKSLFFKGSIEIAGEKIDNLHIQSAINNSKISKIDNDFEILHQLIRNFNIDKGTIVTDPINFFADSLAIDIYQILIKKNYKKSLQNILSNIDLRIDSIIAAPYASSLATLTNDEMEMGTICIDMGSGTTSICMFENNRLMFADSIPVGGSHITNDLVSRLNTSVDSAERLKTLYGSVISKPSDEYELIDISVIGTGNNEVSQTNLSLINSTIKVRAEETLELIRQKLKEYGLHNKKYRRVVLTGGASLLDGISSYAQMIFDSQVRLASPINITGINKDLNKPQFSTAIGLLIKSENTGDFEQFFHEKKQNSPKNTIFSKISSWLDPYI